MTGLLVLRAYISWYKQIRFSFSHVPFIPLWCLKNIEIVFIYLTLASYWLIYTYIYFRAAGYMSDKVPKKKIRLISFKFPFKSTNLSINSIFKAYLSLRDIWLKKMRCQLLFLEKVIATCVDQKVCWMLYSNRLNHKIRCHFWKKSLLATAADGEAANTGHKAGLWKRLRDELGRGFMTFWCIAHRSDLAFESLDMVAEFRHWM